MFVNSYGRYECPVSSNHCTTQKIVNYEIAQPQCTVAIRICFSQIFMNIYFESVSIFLKYGHNQDSIKEARVSPCDPASYNNHISSVYL